MTIDASLAPDSPISPRLLGREERPVGENPHRENRHPGIGIRAAAGLHHVGGRTKKLKKRGRQQNEARDKQRS